MQRASQDVLESLKEFDSATIFNAVVENMGATQGGTELGGKGGQPETYTGPEIKCMLPELGAAIGYAVTAELTPNDADSAAISWSEYYEMLDRMPGPIIAVLKDVDSRPGRGASFGDNMAAVHTALGVTGAVVEGSARDLAGIKGMGLPIWATGNVAGHGVFSLISVNSPLTVSHLQVSPEDLLLCDEGGCAKIPQDHDLGDILERAQEIRTREQEFHALTRKPGFTLKGWYDFTGTYQ